VRALSWGEGSTYRLEWTVGRMTETLLQRLLLGCVVLCAADLAGAQTFANKREAEHFEAVVTPDHLVVRERYRGVTTIYGDLSCPLGPAVKATILPPGTDGRLCFHFLKDKCEYSRFQNGEPIHKDETAGGAQPRMCIALASGEEAKQLAALVNVGPRPKELSAIGSTQSPSTQAPVLTTPGNVSAGKTQPVPVSEPQPPKPAPPPPAAKADGATTKVDGASGSKPKLEAADEKPQASRSASREGASNRKVGDDEKESASRELATTQSKVVVPPGKTITHGYTASGKWLTESFVVGPSGNRRMAERTYASAYILDDKPGRPPGRYLYIRNKSNKHLLFYGLGSGPQSKLEPGGEALITLAYGPAAQAQPQTNQTVTLLWFDRN
jgi:hypothetical protein